MQFEQELKEKTAEVEALLERMLPEEEGLQKTIFSAMYKTGYQRDDRRTGCGCGTDRQANS